MGNPRRVFKYSEIVKVGALTDSKLTLGDSELTIVPAGCDAVLTLKLQGKVAATLKYPVKSRASHRTFRELAMATVMQLCQHAMRHCVKNEHLWDLPIETKLAGFMLLIQASNDARIVQMRKGCMRKSSADESVIAGELRAIIEKYNKEGLANAKSRSE